MLLPITVLTFAFVGTLSSLRFGGMMSQPDWALAILLAAALVQHRSWFWVLPGVTAHDLALFWSPLVTLPLFLLLPLTLYHLDERLGAGLPQRMVALIVMPLPLLWYGMGIEQFLLTVVLSILLWHLLANANPSLP